jgi:hypothetical protein
VTTSSQSYVSRGGPTVRITVPPSGMIDVWAEFDTNDADGGAISLYEDGRHTYELRYADPCPCVGSVFSNRILRIAPRL